MIVCPYDVSLVRVKMVKREEKNWEYIYVNGLPSCSR